MDPRTPFLSPTAPRTTMAALLIVMCLFATVPSTEAAPLASLPSLSSPSGILVAVLSVTVVLSLAVVIGISLRKVLRRWRWGRRDQEGEQAIEQPRAINPPQPITLVSVPSGLDESKPSQDVVRLDLSAPLDPLPTEEQLKLVSEEFYSFIKEWNSHSLEDKEEFIVDMIKEFPALVTPAMTMDALHVMLLEEVNPGLWMRMLRFTMLLERDLFYWYHLRLGLETPLGNPAMTHYRFQNFLVNQAELLLRKYGDVARPNEGAEAGFMRFVAYLFGFVCKDRRILKLMEDTWARLGFRQTDASRAMVWGFRRWLDDPRFRDPPRPTTVESNGNFHMFYNLMRELKETSPVPRPDEGSRAQHLLFALGFGDEPEWGPLGYMSGETSAPEAEQFVGIDYMWLMMGRDLAMGNAWVWMCDNRLSEHDRMCDRFGQDSKMYEDVVDMMMKYEQEYCVEDGGKCLMTLATDYSPDAEDKIKFREHRAWFTRYYQEKNSIRYDLNAWLRNIYKDLELMNVPRDPSIAVEYYQKFAQYKEKMRQEKARSIAKSLAKSEKNSNKNRKKKKESSSKQKK